MRSPNLILYNNLFSNDVIACAHALSKSLIGVSNESGPKPKVPQCIGAKILELSNLNACAASSGLMCEWHISERGSQGPIGSNEQSIVGA